MERNGLLEFSRDEIIQRIEKGAQRRLRMSARDMLRDYRAGRLEDPGTVADLIALANLLPDNDPIFADAA